MSLRLRSLVLVLCLSLFSMPSVSEEQARILNGEPIFQIVQKEMPLPVVKVSTLPLSEGKRQFVIEMSTEEIASAKPPLTMHIAFQVRDEAAGEVEQALRQASAAVKEFIEAAKKDSTLKEVHWLN